MCSYLKKKIFDSLPFLVTMHMPLHGKVDIVNHRPVCKIKTHG
jgi:hypothetical protein